ncbi:hypothetical protein [Phaeovulum sp.]|uniref:hypothetical protein n=1 Tax=Phaeovulum sp. TaxID=2934796 RepID=UPI0039E4E279
MSRHITDHERDTKANSRIAAYLKLERAEWRHPALRVLHERGTHAAEAGRRTAQFARIERGQEA